MVSQTAPSRLNDPLASKSPPAAAFDLSHLGSGWSEKTASSLAGERFAVFEKAILQSPNDDRKYRLVVLANGLTALLISDSTTDKAAASLSVGVGHLSDPPELPGLAHFCEHMLFLGTTKYPNQAEYKQFLSENSGSCNAYTSLDETNYYFDVHPTGMEGALCRHSQFFVSPLFLASCTERELKAVDSEFRKNLQLDSRRFFQLSKATSSREDGAVYWKFGTGNKQTLWDEPVAKGIDVRARLLDWYAQHYSANLMKLVVLSSQSLDELEGWVLANYSAVPNSNVPPPVFDAPALSSKELQMEISYRTVKDLPQLKLQFPFPDQRLHWKSQPAGYIGHVLGHEGLNTPLSELKRLGYATSLSAGSSGGSGGFEFFSITTTLTAAGLINRQQVLQIIFAYLDLMRESGPQEWVFAEKKQLSEMRWRWLEKGQPGSTVGALASSLQRPFPEERILVGARIPLEYDPDLIVKSLDILKAENCRVFIGSKDPLEGREFWPMKEEHYGTEHEIRPLDVSRLKSPVQADANLALPKPNVFLPSNFDLLTQIPAAEPTKRPKLIHFSPTSRLFHKKDDTFLVPRGTAHFLLKSPYTDTSAAAAVKSQLYTTLVEESLAELTYDASIAGLGYSVGCQTDGLTLVVSGYNDKLPLLVGTVLERMASYKVDPARFAVVHERLCRAYANARLNNPSGTGDLVRRRLILQTHWSYEDRLAALEGLKPVDIEMQKTLLLSQLQIESLVFGNISKEVALSILKSAETILDPKAIDPAQLDYHRSLLLPPGSNLVFRPEVPSPENVNSAAIVYYQIGSSTDETLHSRLQLFSQVARVPIFSTLRTVEQLGYIVSSTVLNSRGISGFRVIVQSEKIGEYLEERIEAMWEGFGDYLEALSEEEFTKQKQSLINAKLEKPKTLYQETERYWDEIDGGELDFFHRDREAKAIEMTDKAALVAFFRTYIDPKSPRRSKLSILMRSQRIQPDQLVSLLDTISPTRFPLDVVEAAKSLVASKPTATEVSDFAQKFAANDSDVLEAVKKLSDPRPLVSVVQEIQEDDVESWKSNLERAPPVLPVADFQCDLISHL